MMDSHAKVKIVARKFGKADFGTDVCEIKLEIPDDDKDRRNFERAGYCDEGRYLLLNSNVHPEPLMARVQMIL